MPVPPPMASLHRHQLVYLDGAGWRDILAREWDATALACLAHWARHDLPLVVTRQPDEALPGVDAIAVGLPAPSRWDRRRLALQIRRRDVLRWGEFPKPVELQNSSSGLEPQRWRGMCGDLEALGVEARVYGSHGWQHITGLDHVRAGSDVDLWIAVDHAGQADAVASVLQAYSCPAMRLDGELVFSGHMAVAWREWIIWRAGRIESILVKTLHGAELVGAIGLAAAQHESETSA